MKINRASEYAIRCMLYLAAKAPKVVSRQEVAYAMEVPEHFLAKIAQQLAQAGLIEILQGRYGGYRLRHSPEDINLLQIIEALSGEAFFLNDCVIRPENCRKSPTCPVHKLWIKAREHLRTLFSQATLQSLIEGHEKIIPFREPKERSPTK